MSASMSTSEISRVLHISARAVRRVLHLWRTEGVVARTPLQVGRPRKLDALDLAVSLSPNHARGARAYVCQFLEGCIERTPDIYLTELQDELEEARGIHVSTMVISSSLHRRGYTRKKVCRFIFDRSVHWYRWGDRSVEMQASGMRNVAWSLGCWSARIIEQTNSFSWTSLLQIGAHRGAQWPGLLVAPVHGGEITSCEVFGMYVPMLFWQASKYNL